MWRYASKKKLGAILLASMMVISLPITARAESTEEIIMINSTEFAGVTTRVNSIIYKYRIYKGKLQYRRWDNAKLCWIDSYWITIA